jgi:hypothetical protein
MWLSQRGTMARAMTVVLGALIPGGGHFYLGRRLRGVVFLTAIGVLFILGVAMKARLQVYLGLDDPLGSLLSVAQVATGLPYLVARALGYELGTPEAVTYEYGNTFTAVAGLLNILVILDAYDIGVGRKQ